MTGKSPHNVNRLGEGQFIDHERMIRKKILTVKSICLLSDHPLLISRYFHKT